MSFCSSPTVLKESSEHIHKECKWSPCHGKLFCFSKSSFTICHQTAKCVSVNLEFDAHTPAKCFESSEAHDRVSEGCQFLQCAQCPWLHVSLKLGYTEGKQFRIKCLSMHSRVAAMGWWARTQQCPECGHAFLCVLPVLGKHSTWENAQMHHQLELKDGRHGKQVCSCRLMATGMSFHHSEPFSLFLKQGIKADELFLLSIWE